MTVPSEQNLIEVGEDSSQSVQYNISYVTVQRLGTKYNGQQRPIVQGVYCEDIIDATPFCQTRSQQRGEKDEQEWPEERKRLVNLQQLIDFFSLKPDGGQGFCDVYSPKPDIVSELQEFFSKVSPT